MQYMIQENTLVEIADAVRNKLEYKDLAYGLICDRKNKIFSVTIPSGMTSVNKNAFYGCYNLESVIIPNSMENIGEGMFWNCWNLTSITIPSNVTSIGYWAFYDCRKLTDMYLHPTIPPTLNNTSSISTATTTIYVPIGCGEAYKTATNWSNFADIIVEKDMVSE